MTLDSIFWIASCTKMIAGIAAMQLVEQGKLILDDADFAEKLAPELKRAKILKGFGDDDKPILVEKKNRITLRMLLSHTAGFGYTFFNPEIRKLGFPTGIDEFSGRIEDVNTPLLFEPGTKWMYGVSPHIISESLKTHLQTDKYRLGWCPCRTSFGFIPQRLFPETHLRSTRYQEHLHVPNSQDERETSTYALP